MKYVSQLYSKVTIKPNTFNAVYSAMGSGKTYLIKILLRYSQIHYKNKPLVTAPYRSSKDDLGLKRTYRRGTATINHEFMYTPELIDAFLSTLNSITVHPEDEVALMKAAEAWASTQALLVPFDTIIADEWDFTTIQAKIHKHYANDTAYTCKRIWEIMLQALANHFTLIGFTATYPVLTHQADLKLTPRLKVNNILLTTAAYTSVKIAKMDIVLADGNNTNIFDIFTYGVNQTIAGEDIPVLVYKKSFTGEEYDYIKKELGIIHKKRSILVLRKEKVATEVDATGLDVNLLKHHGWFEATRENIRLNPQSQFYKVVGDRASLTEISEDISGHKELHRSFDYVFVNISSSRQVSLPDSKTRGDDSSEYDTNRPVRVVTFATDLNSNAHQVSGRFRQNPIHVTHYLTGKRKTDLSEYSEGNLLVKMIAEIDPSFRQYLQYYGAMSKFISNKAIWLPALNRQSNTATQARIKHLKAWFQTDVGGNYTVAHAAYLKHPGVKQNKPYGLQTFIIKLKVLRKAKQLVKIKSTSPKPPVK
jgi:hypothetical protein